jgi:hypothetical protein
MVKETLPSQRARSRDYSCDWPPAKRATIKDPNMIAP